MCKIINLTQNLHLPKGYTEGLSGKRRNFSSYWIVLWRIILQFYWVTLWFSPMALGYIAGKERKCASSSSSTGRTTGKCSTDPYEEFDFIKLNCNFTIPLKEQESVFTKELNKYFDEIHSGSYQYHFTIKAFTRTAKFNGYCRGPSMLQQQLI